MTQATAATVAQPSVFDSVPAVSAAFGKELTRPSGTALHVERDRSYVVARRSLRGTCTRDEWNSPAHRRLAIARAWEKAVAALKSEGEELVSFSPVTLYRDADGTVVCADVTLPGGDRKYVAPDGTPLLASPATLALYRRERTTYARWAEGPLPHLSLDMAAAPTPDDDRDLQYVRHQNAGLRALIDGALGPAEWAPRANTVVDDGLVDFRIRAVIRRPDIRRFDSKQTGQVSAVELAGQVFNADAFDTTTQDGLDAALEAD